MSQTHEQGFTAVELLITLFIGAMFLSAGYLLWGHVQRSADEAFQTSAASNIAYDYLRRYEATGDNCSSTPVNNQVPDTNADQLVDPRITVGITCPTGADSAIVKVTSTVTYGSPANRRSVSHAVYAE